MSVVTSYEDVGPCRKKMTIEVPAPAVEAEIGRVVNSFKREIHIPGFRKGKVPASLIKKRFQEDIKREVADRLVPRYWHQAQAEKSIDPLMPPQIESLEVDADQGMSFVAVVEIRPDLEIGELPELDLPGGDGEPTEDEKDDALRSLRRRHATWTEVERGAARGDMVVGQMRALDAPAEAGDADEADDDESAEEDSADDAAAQDAAQVEPLNVELGAPGVDEEMTLALTGLTAGQNTEYSRRHEQDGETVIEKFRLEVEAVKEPDLPELDDELAEKFGFDSAEELTDGVFENLRNSKQRELKAEREKALLEQLRQRYPLELPQGVVDHEGEQMLQDTMYRLSGQGIDVENVGIDWQKMIGDMRPQAEQRVHDRLVLDAMAAHLELKVDESEFERFLAMAAAERQMSSQALRQQLSENGRLEPLRAQLLREQAMRRLTGEDVADDEAADGAGLDEDTSET